MKMEMKVLLAKLRSDLEEAQTFETRYVEEAINYRAFDWKLFGQ